MLRVWFKLTTEVEGKVYQAGQAAHLPAEVALKLIAQGQASAKPVRESKG